MRPIEVHVIMNNSASQILYVPVVFNLLQKQAERTLKILNHSGVAPLFIDLVHHYFLLNILIQSLLY